ncbi:ABC transporter substrate-binding protein [Acidisphaera sp. L21]|uniref:ABC transporter substrate-binding protein n=1 Tax=Acidisphaera sp. L21 TaxID=1641851 RepID=UPI00131D95E5|nr:ABC transporter substrate-binding protein [Acidisphaera sp. L21]
MLTRRTLFTTTAAGTAAAVLPRIGRAQGRPVIKIGVMNDMSGPYRDATGQGSVVCVQQALKQFNSSAFDVQVIAADHQNKPDVGAAIARQWFDRDGVDVIMDVPTSSVALAVNTIAKEKNKLYINNGGGTGDLTGEQCTPVTLHWAYDTYMLAKSTATQVSKLGGNKWYFITADYVFGQQLSRDGIRFAKEAGSTVLGEQRYPFPATTDFSSQLLAAQSSGANVIGLGNAGTDTSNCVKQAHEFGMLKTMKIAALLMEITDVEAIGTDIGAGLYVSATFYWDASEGTRKLTKSVQGLMPAKQPPNMIQAGCYASALHYLKSVTAMGVDKARDGAAICAHMKAMPTDDEAFGKNRIRKDGLCLLPSFLYQVKSTAESKGKWDLQKLVATTPAEQAWKPLAEEGCSLAPSE